MSAPDDTLARLSARAAEIMNFNVRGCRRSAPRPSAECVHLPLDDGDLPLDPLFGALEAAGYAGDVIVQGHGWTRGLPALLHRCVFNHRPAARFLEAARAKTNARPREQARYYAATRAAGRREPRHFSRRCSDENISFRHDIKFRRALFASHFQPF